MSTEKKKLDLLGFQKTLNDQFLEIFESKKNGQTKGLIDTAELGLGEEVLNYKFFFPLKDLKSISNDNKFESVPLTTSWITGFNQIRGEVFTIVDFTKIIELILSNKVTKEHRKITGDSNLLYLKESNDMKTALVLNKLMLEYTAEFTPLFKYINNINTENNSNNSYWILEEGIEFDSFVKKNNMSIEEWNILNEINQFTKENKSFSQDEIEEKILNSKGEEKLLWAMVSNVYLDAFGQHPVFTVDIQRLTKFLMNVSPF